MRKTTPEVIVEEISKAKKKVYLAMPHHHKDNLWGLSEVQDSLASLVDKGDIDIKIVTDDITLLPKNYDSSNVKVGTTNYFRHKYPCIFDNETLLIDKNALPGYEDPARVYMYRSRSQIRRYAKDLFNF